MLLAVLLKKRKEIKSKINRTKSLILSELLTHADLKPKEGKIKSLLEELNKYLDEFHEISKKISSKNAEAGITIMLEKVRVLDMKINLYESFLERLNNKSGISGWNNDVVKVPNYEEDKIIKEIDKAREEKQKIDAEIQKKNWSLEI